MRISYQQIMSLIVFLLIALLNSSLLAESKTIPLKTDNPTEYKGEWLLTCGVPFPKGELFETKRLRVLNQRNEVIPCQIDVTGTWLQDKSIRWVLLNFKGKLADSYMLEVTDDIQENPVTGITIVDEGDLLVDTNARKFVIKKDNVLFDGSQAFLIDNKGRKAVLGGKKGEVETRILTKGPKWTVVRKEGWYVTDGDNERIARGIVWMHFYGNSPYVKIVHRLVHTEDTREVWFKDVSISFDTRLSGRSKATFSTNKDTDIRSLELNNGEDAWIMQDDFPHFMEKRSHFSLTKGEDEIVSGDACGDWCDVSSGKEGLTVVLRNLAEQFPKELGATTEKITVHLWSGRSGKELDFRAKTLVKDYYQEWADYCSLSREDLENVPSNAQSSAKTHTIWYMPHKGRKFKNPESNPAYVASKRILMMPDPKWVCATDVISLGLSAKDEKKYPKAELYISDFFDRVIFPNKVVPFTGYIGWGANPAPRTLRDKKTGKYYVVWWRIAGLVDYHLRKNTWELYARSGERKYFEYGERFNRFAGDFNMHHWDTEDAELGTRKVKGGFARLYVPKKTFLAERGKAGNPGALPFYWAWESGLPGGSGADVSNNIIQFYFTGDWDVWEYAESFGEAVKKYDFMQYSEIGWGGGFTNLRYLLALYSMSWDPALGNMVRNLAKQNMDVNAPNGISEKMRPNPLYKVARVSTAVLEYCRLMDDKNSKEIFYKIADYQYRFQLDKRAIAYQSGSSMYYPMAYILSGDKRFYQICDGVLENEIADFKLTLKDELKIGLDKLERFPARPPHYSYFPFIGIPALMKMYNSVDYKDYLTLPVVADKGDFSENTWAVFKKKSGEPVDLEILFNVAQSEKLEVRLFNEDLIEITDFNILKKEKRFEYPYLKGVRYFYTKIRIPAELPGGIYRIGQKNRGGFTVVGSNADNCMLECPEGFWISNKGISSPVKHYFKVGDQQKDVELFVNRPVTIVRSDGTRAVDRNGNVVGNLVLPVEGKCGFWYIKFEGYAYVKFNNVPPVISYLTPKRFFTIEKFMPVVHKDKEVSDDKEIFVDGVFGKGLQLTNKNYVSIPRGTKLSESLYEQFPGYKGTIEFWFRPNWSVFDRTLEQHIRYTVPLFNAGDVFLQYELKLAENSHAKSNIELWCGHRTYVFKGRKSRFGNYGRYYPREGEWTHIAATWDIDLEENYGVWHSHFYVFINGVKHEWLGGVPAQLRAEGKVKNFTMGTINEMIKLMPANGTFDELRISDIARYKDDFEIVREPFAVDKNTKALMHFDDSLDINLSNGKIISGKFERSGNNIESSDEKTSRIIWTPVADNDGNLLLFPFKKDTVRFWAINQDGLKDFSYDEKTPSGHPAITFVSEKTKKWGIKQTADINRTGEWVDSEYKGVVIYAKGNAKGSATCMLSDSTGVSASLKLRFDSEDWQKIIVSPEDLKSDDGKRLNPGDIQSFSIAGRLDGKITIGSIILLK